MNKRIIAHIDMDAFFASVEEVVNPQFRGRPIVVGADPRGGTGRGVVSTANYAARTFGIHSAMPISVAWKLCPDAVFLPVNGRLYGAVSRRVMALIAASGADVQQVGVDEAYVDLSACKSFRKARTVARALQEAVMAQEGITCSVGIGQSKLVAKIASDFNKPQGLTLVTPKDEAQFLAPLAVDKISGIGPKTAALLVQRGITTVEELRGRRQEELVAWFGKRGTWLYEASHGIDSRPVQEEHAQKSVSEEHTFEQDTHELAVVLEALFSSVERVCGRVFESGQTFGTITVVVRFAGFQTKNRSSSEKFPTDVEYIKKAALKLVWPLLQDHRAVRLVGFRVAKLYTSGHSVHHPPPPVGGGRRRA
ncbi:MAG: DNA polymerase IV [Candidatus Spechtbacterales bacterium]